MTSMILRKLRNWMIAGLVVLLPVWLTLYAVVLIFNNLDSALSQPVEHSLGISLPGLGILLALVATLLAGWLTSHLLGRQLITLGDRLMGRIPVVRAIYKAVKQVTEAVFSPKEQAFSKVVLFEFPREGLYCLGLMAGELPGTDLVRVWAPPGPWPSAGPVLLIPQDSLVILPMTVEDGLKFIVSGGVLTPEQTNAAAMAGAVAELRRRRLEARGALQ